MPHAADMKPPRMRIRVQPGEENPRLGSITVPLTAVEGREQGDQVELSVVGTIRKLGADTATIQLADIQATEAANTADAVESKLRGRETDGER